MLNNKRLLPVSFLSKVLLLIFTNNDALACSFGLDFPLLEAPKAYYSDIKDNDRVTKFINQHYKTRKWKYDSNAFTIKDYEYIDFWDLIPVTVKINDSKNNSQFATIEIFADVELNMVRSTSELKKNFPGQSFSSLLNKDVRYSQRNKFIKSVSAINKVSIFKLLNNTLPHLSTRFNAKGAESVRIFAAIIPADKNEDIIVVIQSETTIIHEFCRRYDYYQGKLPK